MAIVVVGGHSRNIGKTSVVCRLIAAMFQWQWTAIKITQCKHTRGPCDCELGEKAIAITEENNSEGTNDSSRYLAAGALRSLWVRTRQGQLEGAMPRIVAEMASTQDVIFESNRILEFIRPDVYVSVLNPRVADFKVSASRYLSRADALLVLPGSIERAPWPEGLLRHTDHIARFQITPPDYVSKEFLDFMAQRLSLRRR